MIFLLSMFFFCLGLSFIFHMFLIFFQRIINLLLLIRDHYWTWFRIKNHMCFYVVVLLLFWRVTREGLNSEGFFLWGEGGREKLS